MGRSGWLSKGTKLSWISNYCISLVEIQSKVDYRVNEKLFTDGRRTNRHDISPSGLWPVDLKMIYNTFRQHYMHINST